ncbi:hypothetical protein [Halorussus halobius]|uniref:hypothetical protein n=1 Tax=Halorussus halobius TaxID=1710537 RepID=UPI0010922697|nr:hypothetical protein [Halorussus halobius]
MVTVGPNALERFPRFSLYNSPYAAHDEGCAVDLYPHEGDWRKTGDDGESRATRAPSPVAGEVTLTRTVSAPSKPYAVDHDHLIVVDTGEHLARILHVDPGVEPGETVAVGDSLGEMVRSGFFAPWVDNHLHLGFRERDADPVRASGSLPVAVAPDDGLVGVAWDGTGTVVARGDTYAVLDAPDHPAPGERFAGIASGGERDRILDGGLPHYDGGGVLGDAVGDDADRVPVSLAGRRAGVADGRTVAWDDLTVLANGTPITGLSLFVAREALGAKLVCPEVEFAVGEAVSVRLEPADAADCSKHH